jgi:lysozyme
MAWDDREKQELTLDEGRVLRAYKDTRGNWTVGIGHYLGTNPSYADTVITDEQCDEIFDEDFEDAVKGARQAFPAFEGLDGPRKGALVNMSFELGWKTLSTFHTFLNYIDMNQYKEAAIDLLNTAYAKQVPARAKRIAYRIKNGDYAPR